MQIYDIPFIHEFHSNFQRWFLAWVYSRNFNSIYIDVSSIPCKLLILLVNTQIYVCNLPAGIIFNRKENKLVNITSLLEDSS